jgi:hypothetical protein
LHRKVKAKITTFVPVFSGYALVYGGANVRRARGDAMQSLDAESTLFHAMSLRLSSVDA